MSAQGARDAAFDVPDPTDWNGTSLGGFAQVESPMRCQVCKEFMTTPMITSCGHTFCSVCIRRCLSNDGLCPACRSSDQELKLRPNKSMEEVVEAFQRMRASALEVGWAWQNASVPKSPKRKSGEAELDNGSQDEQRKKTRSSSRIASRSTPQRTMEVIDVEDNDGDYKPDDGLVSCPICSARIKIETVNRHLDIHTGESPSDASKNRANFTSRSPSKFADQRSRQNAFQPKPLPTLNYSLLNETNMRKKLRDLGISNSGNKPLLERRHREWLTLWNANCDASIPRPKAELLRQLENWERTQVGQTASRSHGMNSESQIASKDFDSAGWASKHAPAFDELIENARRNVKQQQDGTVPSMSTDPMEEERKPTCTGNDENKTGDFQSNPDIRSDQRYDNMTRINHVQEPNVED